jgi:hypothetical protein
MSFPEIALSKIVWKLKFRQVGKNSTVLILGSRAGSFFRNQRFFETFCEFGDPSFGSLTRIEQFGKIYQILNQGIFTANDIDALLHEFAGEFNNPVREVPSPFMGRDESAVPSLGPEERGFHFPCPRKEEERRGELTRITVVGCS